MTNKKSKSNMKLRISNSNITKKSNKSRKSKKSLKSNKLNQEGSGFFDYLYSFTGAYPYQKVEKLVKTIFNNILETKDIECNVRMIGKDVTKTYIIKSNKKPLILYLTCNIDADEVETSKTKQIKLNITDLSGNFVIKTKNERELVKYSNSVTQLLHILKEVKVIKSNNTDTIELEKIDTFKLTQSEIYKKPKNDKDNKNKNNNKNENLIKSDNNIIYAKHYAIVKGAKK